MNPESAELLRRIEAALSLADGLGRTDVGIRLDAARSLVADDGVRESAEELEERWARFVAPADGTDRKADDEEVRSGES